MQEEEKDININVESATTSASESSIDNSSNSQQASVGANNGQGGNSGYRRQGRYQRDYRNRNNNQMLFKKRICKLCAFDSVKPSYKNPESLRRFVSERGKILSGRITGCCAKHQRYITREIKRARILAYLPFDRK